MTTSARYTVTVTSAKTGGSLTCGFDSQAAALGALALAVFSESRSLIDASQESQAARAQFRNRACRSYHWGPFACETSVTITRHKGG